MEGFDNNVFINCPLDEDFRDILLGVVFAVKYMGYTPRLSTERADAGENRIDKIVGLIEESKFGIHDLSRMVSQEGDEHFRMNMPFELGIDYGCKRLKDGVWRDKQILILEQEQYRYQKSISDLSGSDIRCHRNDPIKAVEAVRNWFVTNQRIRCPSGPKIWMFYNEFHGYLYDQVVVHDGHGSIDEVEVPEIIHHMDDWLQ